MTERKHLQDAAVDFKIVAALEKVSQVLRALSWKTGKALLLNPIQAQILVFLLYHDRDGYSISSLAREFNITKASISDTVSSLERKNLVRKAPAGDDARNFIVRLTQNGRQEAEKAALYAQELLSAVSKLHLTDKQLLFTILGNLIFDLHKSGVIPVQRMCRTCEYYDRRGEAHFCKLLNRPLAPEQLQIDCADHRVQDG